MHRSLSLSAVFLVSLILHHSLSFFCLCIIFCCFHDTVIFLMKYAFSSKKNGKSQFSQDFFFFCFGKFKFSSFQRGLSLTLLVHLLRERGRNANFNSCLLQSAHTDQESKSHSKPGMLCPPTSKCCIVLEVLNWKSRREFKVLWNVSETRMHFDSSLSKT